MATTINATTASGLQVTSDNSGVIQFQQNGANTVTIPNGTGTAAVQGVSTNIVILGAQISTNTGTASITLSTTIPSWAKRVTINLKSLGTNNNSIPLVRIGPSSGAVSSGYLSSAMAFVSTSVLTATSTSGFQLSGSWGSSPSPALHGSMVLTLIDASTNTWIATGTFGRSDSAGGATMGGSISLAGALSIVTLATTNGTDLFNNGTANILYE